MCLLRMRVEKWWSRRVCVHCFVSTVFHVLITLACCDSNAGEVYLLSVELYSCYITVVYLHCEHPCVWVTCYTNRILSVILYHIHTPLIITNIYVSIYSITTYYYSHLILMFDVCWDAALSHWIKTRPFVVSPLFCISDNDPTWRACDACAMIFCHSYYDDAEDDNLLE